MKFGQFSKTNYSISLDMKSQLFIARSNDNPKFEASGITIQDALFALSKIDKNVNFWSRRRPGRNRASNWKTGWFANLIRFFCMHDNHRKEAGGKFEWDFGALIYQTLHLAKSLLFTDTSMKNAEATGSNRATLKILRTFSSLDSLPQYLAKEITIWV